MVVDAPATEAFPRWLTLGEATFITGIDEDTLQMRVVSGKLRSDRSLSRRLGPHYLLVLREDLVAEGLIDQPIETIDTASPPPAPLPVPEPVPVPQATPTFVASTPLAPPLPETTDEPPAAALEAAVPQAISVPLPARLPKLTPRGGQVIRWAIGWTLVGLLVAASAPAAFRYQAFAVTSGAMSPFLHHGDLMLVHSTSASRLRVGDVVAVPEPASGQVTAERIRVLGRAAGILHVETATDATRSVRHWTVSLAGKVLVVSYRVSFVGAILARVPRPAERFVVYWLPGLVLIALALFGLLAPGRGPEIVPAP